MALKIKPHILEKIEEKHSVTKEEVLSVLDDPDRMTERTGSAYGNNKRYKVIGETTGNRILRVITEAEYTSGSSGELTLITAFDAPEADKRRYRRKVRGR